MEHTPNKHFPFFTLPGSKFLNKELKKVDDFVVMVRVTPKITVFNYIDTLVYLIGFLGFSFIMLIELLYIVTAASFPTLLAFLLRNGGILVSSTVSGTPIPPAHTLGVLLFMGFLLIIWGAFWLSLQTRRAIRDFRGLRLLSRTDPHTYAEVSLQKFLRVSLPGWLYPLVNYKPTAEEFLTVLRAREQATEEQVEDSTLLPESNGDEEAKEERPSLSILLSITHQIALSFLAAGGKQVKIILTPAFISLIGFFATRERGVWTAKKEVDRTLFPRKNNNVFTTQRERIDTLIITQAQEAGLMLAEESTDNEPEKHEEYVSSPVLGSNEDDPALGKEEEAEEREEEIDETEEGKTPQEKEHPFTLFEKRMEGKRSFWRLISQCHIEIFPFLSDFYTKVIQTQALPLVEASEPLSLEQLRQGCHRVKEEYGEGFLASHMKPGHLWPWAQSFYAQFQDQCLSILTYANEREREYRKTCQDRKEWRASTEQIAQLYEWQALVGVGINLKRGGDRSEHDMERCLFYYSKVKQISAARASYERYLALRTRIDEYYEPGEALKCRVEEVLIASKASRPRKPVPEEI